METTNEGKLLVSGLVLTVASDLLSRGRLASALDVRDCYQSPLTDEETEIK